MQTTEIWKGYDPPGIGRLNGPSRRCLLAQRQVRPRSVIVVEVRGKNAAQMSFVEDDDVVEISSPDGASRAAAQPIARSTKGLCHGERGAVTTSLMPMALTRVRTSVP